MLCTSSVQISKAVLCCATTNIIIKQLMSAVSYHHLEHVNKLAESDSILIGITRSLQLGFWNARDGGGCGWNLFN